MTKIIHTPIVPPGFIAAQAAAASLQNVETSSGEHSQVLTSSNQAVDEYSLLARDYDLKTDPRYQFALGKNDFHTYLAKNHPHLKHVKYTPVRSFTEFKKVLAYEDKTWVDVAAMISTGGAAIGAMGVAILGELILQLFSA